MLFIGAFAPFAQMIQYILFTIISQAQYIVISVKVFMFVCAERNHLYFMYGMSDTSSCTELSKMASTPTLCLFISPSLL